MRTNAYERKNEWKSRMSRCALNQSATRHPNQHHHVPQRNKHAEKTKRDPPTAAAAVVVTVAPLVAGRGMVAQHRSSILSSVIKVCRPVIDTAQIVVVARPRHINIQALWMMT